MIERGNADRIGDDQMGRAVEASIDVEIPAQRRHVLLARVIDLNPQFIGAGMKKGRQFIAKGGERAAMFPEGLSVQIGLRHEGSGLETKKHPSPLPVGGSIDGAHIPAGTPVITVFVMRILLMVSLVGTHRVPGMGEGDRLPILRRGGQSRVLLDKFPTIGQLLIQAWWHPIPRQQDPG